MSHKVRDWLFEEEKQLKESVIKLFKGRNPDDQFIQDLTTDDLHHPQVQATLRKYMDKMGGFVLIGPLEMGTPFQ